MGKRLLAIVLVLGMIVVPTMSLAKAGEYDLTVSQGINDDIALPDYGEAHPSATITIQPATTLYSSLAEKFIAHDSEIDVYRLDSVLGLFRPLREKRYYSDLSSITTIHKLVGSYYPVVQSQLCNNEQIIGVPTFFLLENLFLRNNTIVNEIGLTNPPATLVELLDFVNSWDERYGDRYQEYSPLFAGAASSYALTDRNPYLGMVLEYYKDTCIASTGNLTYNTPLFISLLDKIKQWNITGASSSGGDYLSETQGPEVSVFSCLQASANATLNQHTANMIITLPIDNGMPVVQSYELECAVVNPFSKNVKAATELATFYAEYGMLQLNIVLSPDVNTPIENPDYEATLRALTSERDAVQQQIDTGKSSNVQESKAMLEFFNNSIEDQQNNRYLVSAAAIKQYREKVAPFLFARGETLYDSEGIYAETMTFAYQWCDGAISSEEFAKKLDAFIKLSIAEGK